MYQYPNPHNWIYTTTIVTYDDITVLEGQIMRLLRTESKTCPAFLCQAYMEFRSSLTKFVVYGNRDGGAYTLLIELNDDLIVVQEVDKDECIVTCSWKSCLYPCEEEMHRLVDNKHPALDTSLGDIT
jgi:hypothetical protein